MLNFAKPYALITIVLICLLLVAKPVQAQETGITLVPPRFELFANPGDIVTESIRVTNRSDTPLTYGIIVEDFSTTGEEGKVVLESDQPDAQFSLREWIEPSSENLTVEPNQEVTFPFTIVVPKNAEPGGHYASILFQIGGPPVEGVTNVQHRVGSLILLRVAGEVVEDATIESFSAPTYSKSSPVAFELRVKNNGTTHIRPNGTIIITNMFGRKIDEISLEGLNVFPGVVRKMETEWTRDNLLGVYTATLVASYGLQNLPLTYATRFTVISPLVAITLIIGSIAAILFIFSLISGRKRVMKALGVLAGK